MISSFLSCTSLKNSANSDVTLGLLTLCLLTISHISLSCEGAPWLGFCEKMYAYMYTHHKTCWHLSLSNICNRKYPPFSFLSYFSRLCIWDGWYSVSCFLWSRNIRGFVFIATVQLLMMLANKRELFGPKVVFSSLHITPSHYHHAELSGIIEHIKCLSYTFCRMYV